MLSFRQESEIYWDEWAASGKFPERLEIKIPIVSDGATMLRPGRSGTPISIIQMEDVESVIGVSSDQVVDFHSLTGDSSDNIPGAK